MIRKNRIKHLLQKASDRFAHLFSRSLLLFSSSLSLAREKLVFAREKKQGEEYARFREDGLVLSFGFVSEREREREF